MMPRILKSLLLGTTLCLPAVMALAGGIDRSGQGLGALFEPGHYVDISYAWARPDVRGKDVMKGRTSNVTGDYGLAAASAKFDVTPSLSAALVFDRPWGGDLLYGTSSPLLAQTQYGDPAEWYAFNNQIDQVTVAQLAVNAGGIQSANQVQFIYGDRDWWAPEAWLEGIANDNGRWWDDGLMANDLPTFNIHLNTADPANDHRAVVAGDTITITKDNAAWVTHELTQNEIDAAAANNGIFVYDPALDAANPFTQDGDYAFSVRIEDAAGNGKDIGTAEITLDTVTPALAGAAAAHATFNENFAVISFDEPIFGADMAQPRLDAPLDIDDFTVTGATLVSARVDSFANAVVLTFDQPVANTANISISFSGNVMNESGGTITLANQALTYQASQTVHAVIDAAGQYIDANADGIHDAGETTTADFSAGGNADLARNDVTIRFTATPDYTFGDGVDLAGFGNDDRIEIEAAALRDWIGDYANLTSNHSQINYGNLVGGAMYSADNVRAPSLETTHVSYTNPLSITTYGSFLETSYVAHIWRQSFEGNGHGTGHQEMVDGSDTLGHAVFHRTQTHFSFSGPGAAWSSNRSNAHTENDGNILYFRADYNNDTASDYLAYHLGNATDGQGNPLVSFIFTEPQPVNLNVIIDTSGAWFDRNADGRLNSTDWVGTGSSYSSADFGSSGNGGNVRLGLNHVDILVQGVPGIFDFTGFGSDDKLTFDLGPLMANNTLPAEPLRRVGTTSSSGIYYGFLPSTSGSSGISFNSSNSRGYLALAGNRLASWSDTGTNALSRSHDTDVAAVWNGTNTTGNSMLGIINLRQASVNVILNNSGAWIDKNADGVIDNNDWINPNSFTYSSASFGRSGNVNLAVMHVDIMVQGLGQGGPFDITGFGTDDKITFDVPGLRANMTSSPTFPAGALGGLESVMTATESASAWSSTSASTPIHIQALRYRTATSTTTSSSSVGIGNTLVRVRASTNYTGSIMLKTSSFNSKTLFVWGNTYRNALTSTLANHDLDLGRLNAGTADGLINFIFPPAQSLNVIIDNSGAWIDQNADGLLNSADWVSSSSSAYSSADFGANGNIQLGFNHVDILVQGWDGNVFDFTGFGIDDKLTFDLGALVDNGIFSSNARNGIIGAGITPTTVSSRSFPYYEMNSSSSTLIYFGTSSTSIGTMRFLTTSDNLFASWDADGNNALTSSNYANLDFNLGRLNNGTANGVLHFIVPRLTVVINNSGAWIWDDANNDGQVTNSELTTAADFLGNASLSDNTVDILVQGWDGNTVFNFNGFGTDDKLTFDLDALADNGILGNGARNGVTTAGIYNASSQASYAYYEMNSGNSSIHFAASGSTIAQLRFMTTTDNTFASWDADGTNALTSSSYANLELSPSAINADNHNGVLHFLVPAGTSTGTTSTPTGTTSTPTSTTTTVGTSLAVVINNDTHPWIWNDANFNSAVDNGELIATADFGFGGNVNLAFNHVDILIQGVPAAPFDFSGFGTDDKITFDVAALVANARLGASAVNGLTAANVTAQGMEYIFAGGDEIHIYTFNMITVAARTLVTDWSGTNNALELAQNHMSASITRLNAGTETGVVGFLVPPATTSTTPTSTPQSLAVVINNSGAWFWDDLDANNQVATSELTTAADFGVTGNVRLDFNRIDILVQGVPNAAHFDFTGFGSDDKLTFDLSELVSNGILRNGAEAGIKSVANINSGSYLRYYLEGGSSSISLSSLGNLRINHTAGNGAKFLASWGDYGNVTNALTKTDGASHYVYQDTGAGATTSLNNGSGTGLINFRGISSGAGGPLEAVVTASGAWVWNDDGDRLFEAGETGNVAANLGAGGNYDLAQNSVILNFIDVPIVPVDLTGFGADDRIHIDLENLFANLIPDQNATPSHFALFSGMARVFTTAAYVSGVSYETVSKVQSRSLSTAVSQTTIYNNPASIAYFQRTTNLGAETSAGVVHGTSGKVYLTYSDAAKQNGGTHPDVVVQIATMLNWGNPTTGTNTDAFMCNNVDFVNA